MKGVKGYNFHILWLKIKCARGWLANGLGRTTFRPSSLLVVKLVYVYEGPLWMLLYRTPHHTTPIFLTQYICRLSHSCKMGVCWVCLLAEEKYTGTQKLTESRQTLWWKTNRLMLSAKIGPVIYRRKLKSLEMHGKGPCFFKNIWLYKIAHVFLKITLTSLKGPVKCVTVRAGTYHKLKCNDYMFPN